MTILEQLDRDGVVVLPGFLQGETLKRMQRAFESRLQRMRWNDFDGYERTERYRHMVQDVLTLEQGFVDAGLHPLVKDVVRQYVGPKFELCETKGWRSLPTMRMFHGWHGDAWYDQTTLQHIPREVKLAFYLSDVKSGGFAFIKGTHKQFAPRLWKNHEIERFPKENIEVFTGPAGTAFLFDTSGVHGQSCPILEDRHACFYNYHESDVPLQAEDIEYYRYHPLALNAAFLGGLDDEDRRILGFGNKTNYLPGYERHPKHTGFQKLQAKAFEMKIVTDEFTNRVGARIRKLTGAKK